MNRYLPTLLLFFLTLCACADGVQDTALAVVLDSQKPYVQRARQVARVSSTLRESDIDAIHLFLDKKERDGLTPLEFNSLKNDLVLCLMRQAGRDDGLVPHLVAMYKDTSHDLVWRNYCVQFMGRLYRNSTMQEKEQLEETLRIVLNDSVPMLAVTGMIGVNLNRDTMGIDRNLLDKRALELLQKDIPLYVKVTLIQICGMNRIRPELVRPMLRDILKNSQDTQLKSSAIAALGEYGNSGDLDVIAPYCESSDIRLKTAAVTARLKIEKSAKKKQ